ncbi:hypothetical protein B9Z19DRAFT_1079876 [Tuber borchii]|uniref:Uncharacterized protein n=1 Tax=Tuber borchii TaxID=42251 RepID=A0A2T6ZXQ1_TUBBO|nr:hypothetical protein B9Z19DRAFT_1079876 [Tuber borchii]
MVFYSCALCFFLSFMECCYCLRNGKLDLNARREGGGGWFLGSVFRSFFWFLFFYIIMPVPVLPCCGCVFEIFVYGGVSVESGVSFFRSVWYGRE